MKLTAGHSVSNMFSTYSVIPPPTGHVFFISRQVNDGDSASL